MTSGSVNSTLSHRKDSVMVLSTGSDKLLNLNLMKGADHKEKLI